MVAFTYLAHADPGLRDVDEQTVLSPLSCIRGLFLGKVKSVLLQVNLYDQRHSVQYFMSACTHQDGLVSSWV